MTLLELLLEDFKKTGRIRLSQAQYIYSHFGIATIYHNGKITFEKEKMAWK